MALPADEPGEATDPPEPVDRVGTVTMLDGAQLEIIGPPSLGLTKLEPGLNTGRSYLPASYNLPYDFGHSFTVERHTPEEPGAVVGRYPTSDGHDLVVYSTTNGVDAVVQYEHWALVVGWNHDRTNWSAFYAHVERT